MELQVGVKAIIRDEAGRVLLLQRAEPYVDSNVRKWDTPGGRINPGEPLLEALRREVKEETSLTLTGTPRLLAAQDILRVEGRHVVRLTYEAQAEGTVQLDPGEHTEYKWVALSDLESLPVDSYLAPVLESMRA